ncbi:hypothetical protein EDD72_102236 [Tepidibacillus fermentans]|uniref:Uncharacterized protein n=1 Tax=Tepidibacillus fermentans TaxID=1281767 RepID=A0A4R3KKZ9_9BACI|nr:hypothetical protein EDD72_102236 [Tepidibacillus fermentans]
MEWMKTIDWRLLGFLSGSAVLDYYFYKHLTWRIAICLPKE